MLENTGEDGAWGKGKFSWNKVVCGILDGILCLGESMYGTGTRILLADGRGGKYGLMI